MSLPSSVDSAPGEYSPDVQHRVCTKALVQLQKEISCVVAFLLEPVLGGAQEVPYWICKLPNLLLDPCGGILVALSGGLWLPHLR